MVATPPSSSTRPDSARRLWFACNVALLAGLLGAGVSLSGIFAGSAAVVAGAVVTTIVAGCCLFGARVLRPHLGDRSTVVAAGRSSRTAVDDHVEPTAHTDATRSR